MSTLALQGGASLRVPMSYEEYLTLGETKHYEYYDGLCHVNPPTGRHVKVAARLTRLLEDACPDGYVVMPEWGWNLAPRESYEPDIMVVPDAASEGDILRVPPLLVVEVTSPSTQGEDRGRKRRAYAGGGAPWYWLADPEHRELVVLRLLRGSYREQRTLRRGSATLDEPFTLTLDADNLFR